MSGKKHEEAETSDIKKKRTLLNLLIVICIVLFAGSFFCLFWILWNSRQEENSFRTLANVIQTGEQEAGGKSEASGSTTGEPKRSRPARDYRNVYELNHDFAAWIRIDGTLLDYPVMSSPYDPQYYIRRDFYGKDSISGTPFLGEGCNVDSLSVIVYGHNMKNGTMFGTLDEYAEESYWKEHPVISFDTLEEEREYEVFSAFQTTLNQGEGENFRYYEYGGDLSKEEYEQFVSQARKAAFYDTGIVPEYGEELLILSTCSYQAVDGRFVLAARRRK